MTTNYDDLEAALRDLDRVLKSMEFRPCTIKSAAVNVSLSNPIDCEGNIDRDYLVVRNSVNEFDFWFHRSGLSLESHCNSLLREGIKAEFVKKVILALECSVSYRGNLSRGSCS